MNKLPHIFGNGVWQMMPSVFTLLLSLVIVRFFSTSVWGIMVGIIVIQQMANSFVSWGNKDFLQREMATNAPKFNSRFSRLMYERLLLLLFVLALVFFSGLISAEYFISFALLVFARFVQQSFDILIIKERKFRLAVALEIGCLLVQLLALFFLKNEKEMSIVSLLAVFWIPAIVKSIFFLIAFRSYLQFGSAEWLLPKASFFAMLSITGLVHSKIDVLVVSKLVDAETLGIYQIIMACLWNIQSAAMYISGPYVHNFYRLNVASRRKYSGWLLKLGILIVPFGIATMVLLLHFGFEIQVSWPIIAASLLFGSASFIYLPWILQMNSQNRESRVLLINIIGILSLIAMLTLTQRFCAITLERLLWIVTIQQLFLTLAAFANKNQNVWKLS